MITAPCHLYVRCEWKDVTTIDYDWKDEMTITKKFIINQSRTWTTLGLFHCQLQALKSPWALKSGAGGRWPCAEDDPLFITLFASRLLIQQCWKMAVCRRTDITHWAKAPFFSAGRRAALRHTRFIYLSAAQICRWSRSVATIPTATLLFMIIVCTWPERKEINHFC